MRNNTSGTTYFATLERVHEGVEGTTAKEQFKRLIQYVLNFLTGESEMEEKIYNKALKLLE